MELFSYFKLTFKLMFIKKEILLTVVYVVYKYNKSYIRIARTNNFSLWLHGGTDNWSRGIWHSGHGFEFQGQWVRFIIISKAVFRSFLVLPRLFHLDTSVSSTNKKQRRSNSKLVTSCKED